MPPAKVPEAEAHNARRAGGAPGLANKPPGQEVSAVVPAAEAQARRAGGAPDPAEEQVVQEAAATSGNLVQKIL